MGFFETSTSTERACIVTESTCFIDKTFSSQLKTLTYNVTPEDYKKLQEEIAILKKDLAQERLRADFYEEMVVFGKEVYGIDLKKVGTK